ncbi:MAG TPA: SDR family oxidoreductase [Marivita sp.]|nr:SDR family oxidoreductase [Marivita sp.]
MTKKPLTLVTGGSAGIGEAIVKDLGKAGHRLAFSYLTNDVAAQRLVAALRDDGVEATAYHADLSKPGGGHALAHTVLKTQGSVTHLVNNVGPGALTPFGPGLAAQASDMFQRNVSAGLELMEVLVPTMQNDSAVLNVSSLNARFPPAKVSAFAASKAALDAATKALAAELGPRGIRVLGVAPGPIEREDAPRPEEVREKVASKTALPRFGTVEDVAQAVTFLLSAKASFINGEIIGIHGGWIT